jgi:hypothetical protein
MLPLTDPVPTQFPRLRYIQFDAGYRGEGNGMDWIEQALGRFRFGCCLIGGTWAEGLRVVIPVGQARHIG